MDNRNMQEYKTSLVNNREFANKHRDVLQQLIRRGITAQEALLCADVANAYELEVRTGVKRMKISAKLQRMFRCSYWTIHRRLKKAHEKPY